MFKTTELMRCRIAQAASANGHIHILLWMYRHNQGLLLQSIVHAGGWRCIDSAAANGHVHVLRCVVHYELLCHTVTGG